MSNKFVTLLSGHQMPLFGYTASVYRNEQDIGKIFKVLLPKYNLKREDIFITSKLAPSDQGKGKAITACLDSIERLDCGYLDLYLIHWPGTHKLKPEDPRHKQFRRETWCDLEAAVKSGKVRAIGVSNYLHHHLEDLLSYCCIKPSVLQTEYHPHLIQRDVKSFCDEHNIHLQAYSSLGTSSEGNKLLKDPTVLKTATVLGRSPALILLGWALQQNIGVIPKSTNPKHICENIEAFSISLDGDQMEALNSLDQQIHYCWNPKHIA